MHAEVVRDQDDREVVLAPQPVEQPQDAGLHRHVERRRRLVGDQQPRPAGERDRDRDALAHPARELVRERVAARRAGSGIRTSSSSSTARRSAPGRARARGAGARARSAGVPTESIGCSDVNGSWKTIAMLAARDRRAAARRGMPQQVAAAEARGPLDTRPSRQQAEQREHRHRLAAAALAGDAEDLARLDRVVDAVDDRHVAAPASAAARAAPRPRGGSCLRAPRGATPSAGRTRRAGVSPRKLNASTTVKIARPGKVPIHHHWKYCVPSATIDPHSACRRLRAEAEEREPGEQQDRVREVERREHEDRPGDVRAARRGRARAARTRRAAAPTARTPSRRPRARARARRGRTTATRRRRSRAPRCAGRGRARPRRPSPG